MNKYNAKTVSFIFSFIVFILISSGCESSDYSPTEPVEDFKLDGVWQSRIFDTSYTFTPTIAYLRTNGAEVKGNLISDCFGIFSVNDIPFRITEGVYTGTDISLTFIMETTNIVGHFNGNLKTNTLTKEKVIVGHIKFEYSGILTRSYAMHLIKQSITYFPKRSHE